MKELKESVLDVLMYLFENYIDEDQLGEPDRDDLEDRLIEAGFGDIQVERAFDWLEGLASNPELQHSGSQRLSTRIYAPQEADRLGTAGMGFITFLEQNGVLSMVTREQLIERVLALDSGEINIEQLKWVVLMVLFNQPDEPTGNLAWLEELVYDDRPSLPH